MADITLTASTILLRGAAGDAKAGTSTEARTLLNVENGSTADQSDAEVKTAYENNADTNEFSDAEQTKLSGIETSATADQSNAEIKTAYEANADTNEFSDAEQTKLSGIATSADVSIGIHTIWVPAAAMRPTASNGCAILVDIETTAGRPDMQVLDFDSSADEHAQFQVGFPKSWDEGTITFKAFWTQSAAVSTGIAIALQGLAITDNVTIDAAYGTAVVITDDAQGAAEELYVTAESGNVTIGGTPAESDLCFFRLFRDVSDANDNMTQDMRLLGIQIFYTIDAGTDA